MEVFFLGETVSSPPRDQVDFMGIPNKNLEGTKMVKKMLGIQQGFILHGPYKVGPLMGPEAMAKKIPWVSRKFFKKHPKQGPTEFQVVIPAREL